MSLKTYVFKYKILDRFSMAEHDAEFRCQAEKMYQAMDKWVQHKQKVIQQTWNSIRLVDSYEESLGPDILDITKYIIEG